MPERAALPLPAGFSSWEEAVRLALAEAKQAAERGEVPVGAVVIALDGTVLSRAGNAPIGENDPTAHAELLALRAACRAVGNYRLEGAVLVATLEPCLMCLGAMAHARISGLVYGAPDPKAGVASSNLPGPALPFLNHRFPVVSGVLEEECGDLLRTFFRARRKK